MNRSAEDRIKLAMDVIDQYGGTDESHHLRWVLDQVVQELIPSSYESWVQARNNDGYDWDVGVPP